MAPDPKIRTCLFLRDQAEAAARFYVAALPDGRIDGIVRPDPDGPALAVEFSVAGHPCMTLNGDPDPRPSHMVSLSVMAEDQAETDRLWDALIAGGGEPGRCGWLRDRFGMHWQIVPRALPRLMDAAAPEAAARVHAALMGMTRIDVAALEAAASQPA